MGICQRCYFPKIVTKMSERGCAVIKIYCQKLFPSIKSAILLIQEASVSTIDTICRVINVTKGLATNEMLFSD